MIMTEKTVPVRTLAVAPRNLFEGLLHNIDRLFEDFGGFGFQAQVPTRPSPRLDVTTPAE